MHEPLTLSQVRDSALTIWLVTHRHLMEPMIGRFVSEKTEAPAGNKRGASVFGSGARVPACHRHHPVGVGRHRTGSKGGANELGRDGNKPLRLESCNSFRRFLRFLH
jgi:hypothetical protein